MTEHSGPESFDRHPSDVLRLILGTLVFIFSAVLVRAGVGSLESDVARLLGNVSESAADIFRGVVLLVAVGAFLAAVTLAFLTRRHRFALALVLAAAIALIAAELLPSSLTRGAFPSTYVTMASALATVARPYLSQRWRRVSWVIAWTIGLLQISLETHLLIDVAGGAGLGWAVGAAIQLLVGSPGGRLSTEAVKWALEDAGIRIVEVYKPDVDARGSTPYFAEAVDGPDLFVKIVGKEQRNADLLFKTSRFLMFQGLEDETPYVSPKQQIEHEALLSLLAERAGVRTPTITLALEIDDGATLLAQERVSGRGLDALAQDNVDDIPLREIFGQVALLRKARIAHRDLRQANVIVDEGGRPWLIDFGFAEIGASERRLNHDIAEMMASLACLVSAQPTVEAALDVMGKGPVLGAMPLLQPLALSTATRTDLKTHPELLEEIREHVASITGEFPPPPERFTRLPLRIRQ